MDFRWAEAGAYDTLQLLTRTISVLLWVRKSHRVVPVYESVLNQWFPSASEAVAPRRAASDGRRRRASLLYWTHSSPLIFSSHLVCNSQASHLSSNGRWSSGKWWARSCESDAHCSQRVLPLRLVLQLQLLLPCPRPPRLPVRRRRHRPNREPAPAARRSTCRARRTAAALPPRRASSSCATRVSRTYACCTCTCQKDVRNVIRCTDTTPTPSRVM